MSQRADSCYPRHLRRLVPVLLVQKLVQKLVRVQVLLVGRPVAVLTGRRHHLQNQKASAKKVVVAVVQIVVLGILAVDMAMETAVDKAALAPVQAGTVVGTLAVGDIPDFVGVVNLVLVLATARAVTSL